MYIGGNYEDQFIKEVYTPPRASKLPRIECNCVQWAKMYLGRENEVGWGYPEDMLVSQTPRINGLVVMREGEYGHLGVIRGIVGDTLYIIEANYEPCEISTRSLDIDSSLIRGYMLE